MTAMDPNGPVPPECLDDGGWNVGDVPIPIRAGVDDERLAQIREMDEYEILDMLDRTGAEVESWAGRCGHAEAGEDIAESRLAAVCALRETGTGFHTYETRDIGDAYLADSVNEFLAALDSVLGGDE